MKGKASGKLTQQLAGLYDAAGDFLVGITCVGVFES
jgi:hypothetical protein